ncbi:MAG: SAM-dependent methyltransferase [Patiriisocius sp.]|jgi:SAM-dependent methyltransferase
MPDSHYTHRRLAALYDLDSPWGPDTDFYVALAGPSAISIVDFGCGTGTLCCGFAASDHSVHGIDPAIEMLRVARSKPFAEKINWVQSDIESYRSAERFDLVTMTGHAFQVLLTDESILAAFETIVEHLRQDGLVAFESRNPTIDWDLQWCRSSVWALPEGQVTQTRSDLEQQGELLSFAHEFVFSNETIVSESILRFASLERIESLLIKAGLTLVECYGDWNAAPFVAAESKEMIFIARVADR